VPKPGKPPHAVAFLDAFLQTIPEKERRRSVLKSLEKGHPSVLNDDETGNAIALYREQSPAALSRRDMLRHFTLPAAGVAAGLGMEEHGRRTESGRENLAGAVLGLGSGFLTMETWQRHVAAMALYAYVKSKSEGLEFP
jgi:hypothetical protein